jgi:hypothetical protein
MEKIGTSEYQRKRGCPGFRLAENPSFEWVFDSSQEHLEMERDFDGNGVPYTYICDHQKCSPGDEYRYALIGCVGRDVLTEHEFYSAYPKRHRYMSKYRKNAKPECSGFRLVHKLEKNGIISNPIRVKPYTESCKHNPCNSDPAAFEKYMLVKLVAMKKIDRSILDAVEEFNWARRLDEYEEEGINLTDILLGDCMKPATPTHIWNPKDAMNYSEIVDRRDKGILLLNS